MSSASSYDVLFFIAAGAVGLGAFVVFLWAWFGDRSRGRRRCPKCWYDMSQTPGVVCSECGRDARTEKRLFKTRRRKRWAAVAALFVGGATALALTPKVKRDGWWSVMPNTVLILALRWEWDFGPYRTLRDRLHVQPLDENEIGYLDYDRLFGWQLSVLTDAAMQVLEHSEDEFYIACAHHILEEMIDRGRDLPDRYSDILVDFIRDPFIRGDAKYLPAIVIQRVVSTG